MQPNVVNQRRKLQKKAPCPDMMQTRVEVKKISRKTSLPVLKESLEPAVLRKRYHSEGSECKEDHQTNELKHKNNIVSPIVPVRKVSNIARHRLHPVIENPERE